MIYDSHNGKTFPQCAPGSIQQRLLCAYAIVITFEIMVAAGYLLYKNNAVGGSEDLANSCQSAVTTAFGADVSLGLTLYRSDCY